MLCGKDMHVLLRSHGAMDFSEEYSWKDVGLVQFVAGVIVKT